MMIFLHAIMASCLAKTCLAAATASSSFITRKLTKDEIILFSNDGRVEVMQRSQYQLNTSVLTIATPEQHYGKFPNVEEENSTSQKIFKRCMKHNVYSSLKVDKYINWDVPMSSTIRAPADSSVSISVAKGYWIGNSLKASSALNLEQIKLFLFKSLGVAVDQSWTTTYSSGYSYMIPPGKYGAIVTNPFTLKYSGYVDSGCIGHTNRTEFSFESYETKEFAKMTWVDGIISLCLGDTFPLPKCIGNGTL